MAESASLPQNERFLAALAHGSLLLGVLTGGAGGIFVALMIWLFEKDKTSYTAYQARQALVYQGVALVVMVVAWMIWLVMWLAMILLPVWANPHAYDAAPPAGMWVGLVLLIVPTAISAALVLYGLWGALRCLGGHPFRYALLGRWMAQ